MTDVEIAWVAGLLEGEGWFGINGYSSVITLVMADLDIIKKFKALIDCNNRITVRPKAFSHHKDTYSIGVCGKQAFILMNLIRPFMGERRGAVIDDVILKCEPYYRRISDSKCKRGHDISSPNSRYLYLDGSTACKECIRLRHRNKKLSTGIKLVS